MVFLIYSLSLTKLLPPQSSSHISLSFKACSRAGLGLWSWHGDRRGFWILDQHGSTEIEDCGGLCLGRWAVWVMGQVVGLELWVRWWVWIGGSVYHGSGGGVGLDQLWLVGLDRGNWWVSRWRLVGLDQWSWWVSWWKLVDFWVNVCCVYGFVGSFDGGSDGEFFFFWLGLN